MAWLLPGCFERIAARIVGDFRDRGETGDPRSDLFSLGCVLYEMCTGEIPFKGANTLATLHALALSQPMPPLGLNPALLPELSQFVMQLLAKDPNDRPASAALVVGTISDLEREAARQTAPVVIPAGEPAKPPAVWGWTASRLIRGLAAAVLLSLGCLAAYWLGPALLGSTQNNPTSALPDAPDRGPGVLRRPDRDIPG
jgi:serine/threonine protein kinase